MRSLPRSVSDNVSAGNALSRRTASCTLISFSSREYFGKYYQDIHTRVPSITAAKETLGWQPKTDLRTAIRLTLDYHLGQTQHDLSAESAAS